MDISDLIEYENENTSLDFKKTQYHKNDHESLLKDLMAMANAITTNDRYIIVGVKHFTDGRRELHGVDDEFVDDSVYQQLIDSNIEPKIMFNYFPYQYKGKTFGVFHIRDCANPPYMMKKRYGKLDGGYSCIRKGSFQKRLTRSDIDEHLKVKEDRDISTEVFVSLDDKDVVKNVILRKEKLYFPSRIKRREIEEIIKNQKKEKTNNSLHQDLMKIRKGISFTGWVPYEDRDIETLENDLKNLDEVYKEDDKYYLCEEKAKRINFYILNQSSNFLEGTSVEIVIPKSENYCIMKHIYKKSVTYSYPFISKMQPPTPSFDELGYPNIEINKDGNYRICSEIGNVKHKLPSSVFEVPIRFVPLNQNEDFNVEIVVRVFAKNIKKPIEETLILEIK